MIPPHSLLTPAQVRTPSLRLRSAPALISDSAQDGCVLKVPKLNTQLLWHALTVALYSPLGRALVSSAESRQGRSRETKQAGQPSCGATKGPLSVARVGHPSADGRAVQRRDHRNALSCGGAVEAAVGPHMQRWLRPAQAPSTAGA